MHFTYIIHVSTAHSRRKHMEKVIAENSCIKEHDFVLKGDIKDLSEDILNKYFSENSMLTSQVSCAYKHILSYENIVENHYEYALILEDDIILSSTFCQKIGEILNEIKANKLSNFIISLEDSNLKYVKQSELISGKMLYKKDECRFTGAYLIDFHAADNMLNEIKINKIGKPIDWFQNQCSDMKLLDIYWAHPTIAKQGSTDGSMETLIGEKKYGFKRIVSRNIQRFLKKLFSKFK